MTAPATDHPAQLELPDGLTDVGRVAAGYAALQRASLADAVAAEATPAGSPAFWSPYAAPAAPAEPLPPKPSKSHSRAARALAVQGARLVRQGQHPQAIAALRQSVALDPTVAATWHDLGYACMEAAQPRQAADAFRAAIRLNPDLAAAHYYLAVVLERLARVVGALTEYEAAVTLDPGCHPALFRLGQLYFGRGRRAEAEAVFHAATLAASGFVQARIAEAYASYAAGRLGEARAMLRAVIDDDPACGVAYLVLGEMSSEAGHTTEAAACYERGIACDPAMITAWQAFATNTKFTIADQELIERIRDCLERPDLTVIQGKAIHFALGKAYDDIGDHAEAMRHFDAANRIRSEVAVLDRATLARQTSQMIAASPPGYLDRRPDLGVADETPILIVGMPRSGTTLVEQILSSHPDVAAGGEQAFWGERNDAGLGIFGADARPEEVRRLADDYLATLRAISPGAARVTDKMPFNFGLLGVIRQVFPRAAIVHCRRHPVDTCLSIFCTDFEAAIDFAGDRGSLVFFYRQYQRLMAHWRDVLPPERFIEVDYERLVADPEPVTRRLIAACGLDWNDACLAPHRNQRRVTTASVWQARQPIYRTSVERWRRYEPWLGELRQLLPAEQ